MERLAEELSEAQERLRRGYEEVAVLRAELAKKETQEAVALREKLVSIGLCVFV